METSLFPKNVHILHVLVSI